MQPVTIGKKTVHFGGRRKPAGRPPKISRTPAHKFIDSEVLFNGRIYCKWSEN